MSHGNKNKWIEDMQRSATVDMVKVNKYYRPRNL